ncbi:MAG: phosphoribosylglycinamide formyltransferase [SAR202 cluster bacterium]|nr:phosphoribosylglycinamide formyltransferase [SAR202 cluster bacterium]
MNLGVMASHGGTNLQAIMDACATGDIYGNVKVVVSNNSRSKALRRASNANIPSYHMSAITHPDTLELERSIKNVMTDHKVDLIVLAGYMKKIGSQLIEDFPKRVVNSHPALLPKYGGEGMYGDLVHAAVINAGETESGVTIHLVDQNYDQGTIIAQVKIPIAPQETVDSLREKIQTKEHSFWIETIEKIRTGEIDLDALTN